MGLDSTGDKAEVLDFEAYPNARKLVDRCREFFAEVQNLFVNELTLSTR